MRLRISPVSSASCFVVVSEGINPEMNRWPPWLWPGVNAGCVAETVVLLAAIGFSSSASSWSWRTWALFLGCLSFCTAEESIGKHATNLLLAFWNNRKEQKHYSEKQAPESLSELSIKFHSILKMPPNCWKVEKLFLLQFTLARGNKPTDLYTSSNGYFLQLPMQEMSKSSQDILETALMQLAWSRKWADKINWQTQRNKWELVIAFSSTRPAGN